MGDSIEEINKNIKELAKQLVNEMIEEGWLTFDNDPHIPLAQRDA